VLDGNSEARRVLIVEDEPLLAMNIEDMLTELGHHVVATATRVDKALTLAEGDEFNFAVLDINLAGSNTFQVAAILRNRGIPFIFTSGYGADGLVDGYRGAHLLTKPFGRSELEHMIAHSLSADAT
jgi:CheY-like chemotaxis protein